MFFALLPSKMATLYLLFVLNLLLKVPDLPENEQRMNIRNEKYTTPYSLERPLPDVFS